MSKSKSIPSISDQISDALKPKQLTEEETAIECAVEEFNENLDEAIGNRLSEIRKQTAKSLNELDDKYKGKAVSRKELELDDEEEDSEGSSDDQIENGNYATDSDDEELESQEDEEEDQDDEEEDQDDEEEDQEENSDVGSDEDGSGSGSDEDEEDFDDGFDLSQFSKQQSKAPTSSTQANAEIIKDVSLSEEIKKGIAVQNQLKLWEKLLEVRIKSQKMLISANSLPDFDAHLELAEEPEFSDKVEATCEGIHQLMDDLLELKETLVNRFPESKDVFPNSKRRKSQKGTGGFLKKSKLAEYSERIEENHNLYTPFRNQVLQKWNDRTKSVKDAKNPLANLNIITKIENSLLNKNEMIRKTQIYRGDYEIYGVEKSADDVEIPEIFDDSEFYHQLLRELIEYKSNVDENQSEITQKFIELQKVRSKMKKKVDTRASKGRKIRYVVHNKLVNFMPPTDNGTYTEEARDELFNSLFGMANQGENL